MKHRLSILLTILVLLLTTIPLAAQDNSDAYLLRDGDLWAWDASTGSIEQLTEWGFNSVPVLSPTGNRIAYASVAEEAVERGATDSYLVYAPTPANNIWIMDTATQTFTRIADQSAGFPTLRGLPVFSPDGREIAWIDYRSNDETTGIPSQLMIYNFASGETRNAGTVNLGFQDGGLYLPRLHWGNAGISYQIFTFVESGGTQHQLYVIDPVSGNGSQFVMAASDQPFDESVAYPRDHVPVTHNGRGMIAALYNDGSWRLLDPANGSLLTLPQPPSLVPVNGIGASLTPDYVGGGLGPDILWRSTAPNGITQDLQHYTHGISRQNPALSPSGTIVMIPSGDGYTYQRIDGTDESGQVIDFVLNDQYHNIDPVTAVWTPLRWVTDGNTGNPVPTPSNPNPPTGTAACDLPLPFAQGDLITVQAGTPNNLRASASVSGQFTASLYPGDVVSVADGPVCADGFRWWNIAGGGGFSGWTAEGTSDGSEAWLLRLPQSPLINECPLPPRLSRGSNAVVLAGEPNVLRNGPDVLGFEVIDMIPAGAEFEVLGNSLCGTDGRRWYPVDYDGRTGWTAEGEGSTYWIEPLAF